MKSPSASLPSRLGALAAAERDAEREVARLRAGAGQHQVAEARQARQRLGARAAGPAEPRQFGEAARGQRRQRRGAELAALDDAGRDRQHVLGRAADLDAAHVGGVIGPEGRRAQRLRQRARQRFVAAPRASPRSAARARRRRRSSGPTGSPASRPARPRR